MRHVGTLSEKDRNLLQQLELEDIAKLAAHQRGKAKKHPGTATRAIRHWVVAHKTDDELRVYDKYYRQAWKDEKHARWAGTSSRPANRLCIGRRPSVRVREASFVRDYDEPLAAYAQPKSSAYA